MNETDPALWRWLLEHFAVPFVGGIWAGLAYWVNMISNKFKTLEERQKKGEDEWRERLGNLVADLPKTYATKTETAAAIKEVGEKMDRHLDTISTDVRTLHGDVKDLLKIVISQGRIP